MPRFWTPILTLALLMTVLSPCRAGDGKEMKLWPEGAPGAKGESDKDVPVVYVYLPPKDKANGSAVVICPGGGYGGLAISYEGHDVARWFNSLGTAGLVLRYRHAPKYRHPIPLNDASRALRFTRAHAKEWGLDPQRIGIMGFSAGGHLASTAETHFDAGNKEATDPIERESSRPDFAILVYPVITMSPPYTHLGSRKNLLGDEPDQQLVDSVSNEKQVTAQTPPTFILHTTEDKVVPVENAVQFYLALKQAKVPAELHVYEKGPHGVGLGAGRTNFPVKAWAQSCQAWLEDRGILGKRQP
jgi:acetyl esterase/lipase